MKHVRQAEHEFVELGLYRDLLLFEILEPASECLARRHERRDVLSLCFRLPHFPGVDVARGTCLVGRHLGHLATLLQRAKAFDVQHEAAPRKIAGDRIGIGAKQLGVEHGGNRPGSA